MADQPKSNAESVDSSSGDDAASVLIDQEPSSMVQDGGFGIGSCQDEDNDENSEVHVVHPDDVMMVQVIRESATDQRIDTDVMAFPEKGVLYEFPTDSDDAIANAAGAEFFNPLAPTEDKVTTAHVHNFDLKPEEENRNISSIEASGISETKESAAAKISSGSDLNVNSQLGSDRKQRKQLEKRENEDNNADECSGWSDKYRDLTSSSDEFETSSSSDFVPKRRKLSPPDPTQRVEEYSDEGNLADDESNGSSSKTLKLESPMDVDVPITGDGFGPGGVFGVLKAFTSAVEADESPEDANKLVGEKKSVGAECTVDSNFSSDLTTNKKGVTNEKGTKKRDPLFKEPMPVKINNDTPAYILSADLPFIKEEVISGGNAEQESDALSDECTLIQCAKYIAASIHSTDLPSIKEEMKNEESTEQEYGALTNESTEVNSENYVPASTLSIDWPNINEVLTGENADQESDALPDESTSVKCAKYVAASISSTDWPSINEEVTSGGNTDQESNALPDESTPVESAKYVAASTSTDWPSINEEVPSGGNTDQEPNAHPDESTPVESAKYIAASTSTDWPSINEEVTSGGNTDQESKALPDESTPVKSAMYVAASISSTDWPTFKEVTNKGNTEPESDALLDESTPVKSAKYVAASSFPTDLPDMMEEVTDETSTEPENVSEIPAPAICDIPDQRSMNSASTSLASGANSLKMKKKVSLSNRCAECNSKLGLTAIRCRCDNYYCAKHRYDRAHNCTFDYKAMGAEEIRKNNPQVVAEKVRKL